MSGRPRTLDSAEPFKGNIDTARLKAVLDGPDGSRVAAVIMTLTNNGGGGQPVSMANLTLVSSLCRERGVPLFLDAARFAENAWLVTQREPAYRDHSRRQVAEEAFRLADGCAVSAKKDGIAHIGGFLGLNDSPLARHCELLLIATEGFPTYGGLAGRDLDMVAQGLSEVTDPRCLRARAEDTAYLADRVRSAGVDIWSHRGCTRSASTPAVCCRTSRRTGSPARRWPAGCTWRAAHQRARPCHAVGALVPELPLLGAGAGAGGADGSPVARTEPVPVASEEHERIAPIRRPAPGRRAVAHRVLDLVRRSG